LNGVEKVAVGVTVGVSVTVGVEVGVEVLVAVKVMVGVGVSVAKSLPIGLSAPESHTINEITPPRTSKPAITNTIFGPRRCLRLRKVLILLAGEDEMGGLLFISFSFFTKRVCCGAFPRNAMQK
jgi:hypothetical protein